MSPLTPNSDSILADWLARATSEPALRGFVREDTAILLLSADGRIVHGNAGGLALASDDIPAATLEKVRALAGGLAPLNGLRIEQLDLPGATGVSRHMAACRRLKMEDGAVMLVIAAQGYAPRRAPDPAQTAINDEPAAPEPEAAGVAPIVPPAPALTQRAPLPAKLRFVWEIGADETIRSLSAEASQAFGPGFAARMVGRPWRSLCDDLVHDPDGAIAEAFATGRTWSGKPSLWRIDGGDEAFRVILSGLPITDGERRLTGWRGFGVIHTQATEPFPQAAIASEPAEEPAAALPDDGDQATPVSGDDEPELPFGEAEREDASTEAEAVDESAAVEPGADGISANDVPEAADAGLPLDEPPAPASLAAPARAEPTPATVPPPTISNVVPMRPLDNAPKLTRSERNAFREIAKALGARIEGEDDAPLPAVEPAANTPAMDPAPPAVEAEAPAVMGAPLAPGPEAADAPAAGLPAIAAPPAAPPTPAAAPVPPREDAFEALLDKLPIGVLVLKAERIAYANRTLLDLLDHESLAELAAFGADRLFRGEVPTEGGPSFALMRRDGGTEPVDARLSPIQWHGEAGTLMSFRRSVETVDAARLEALKLDVNRAREQSRELTAILDTATDGVATLDERGRILWLNRSAEALFGYDQREVTGENFTLMLAPESHITALDYLEGLKGGGVASLLNDGREVQGRVRQGGRIPLFMTMGRVAEGEQTKYSVVLRDMTAWKRAEADLVEARRSAERASAQKSDVLAKISHEIRTPLNAILGFTEVMSEERFGPIGNERYKEYLNDIHQSGGYLISLINDLLDLAKIEAGKMDLNFVGVNINEVASSAVSLLQPEANRQRVVLRTGLQSKLPAVVADDRSLRQIVINVLSNAVKFTDAGGQVILSTAIGDRGEVILRVRDTGVGMTEKELSMAMEPFRQVSATRRGSGTGLGLPITKALVEANKASLAISSAKNEGTLVEITFPPQRVLAS